MAERGVFVASATTVSKNTPDTAWIPDKFRCPGGCKDVYEDPRMLPCLHRICRKCLLRQLKTTVQDGEKSKENLESELSEEKGENEEKKKQVMCPVCKETHPLPEKGIDGFVQDLRLQLQSQAAIHYASRLGNGATCATWVSPHEPSNEGHGSQNQKDAVSFCCSCHEFYCQRCSDYHQELMRRKEGEDYQEHTLIYKSEERAKERMLEEIRPQDFLCTENKRHKTYVLGTYCKTCDKLACYACVHVQHKDHSYEELTDTSSTYEQEMDECLNEAKTAIGKLQDAITSSEKMERDVNTAEKEIKKEIDAEFIKLENALHDRKEELYRNTRRFAEDKINELGCQRKTFKHKKTEIERCKEEVETVRKYTPEEIVTLKRIPQARLRSVLEDFNTFRLDLGENDNMPRSLDAQQLVDDVGRFGVITGGCSPERSTVSCHIPGAVKGKERRFVVKGYTKEGTPFEHGGEEVAAELIFNPQQPATRPSMQRFTPVDNNDGTYTVSFTPELTGEHHLIITIRNRPIKGCPFTVSVREPRDYTTISSSPQQSLSTLGDNYVYSDPTGNLHVVSRGTNTIKVFTSEGKFLKEGYVIVAEYGNNRVQILRPDNNENVRTLTGFSSPQSVVMSKDGFIHVGDRNNYRILKY